MNTLTILARVHERLSVMYGHPMPYEIAEMKRIIVVGLSRELADADFDHMSSLTCETPEEVQRMWRQWRHMAVDVRNFWIRLVTEQ
jgi:hypothetical protein